MIRSRDTRCVTVIRSRDTTRITANRSLDHYISLQFAVYSLDNQLPDDMVEMYLLQLVECIKYELYLDCALTR